MNKSQKKAIKELTDLIFFSAYEWSMDFGELEALISKTFVEVKQIKGESKNGWGL